MTEKIPAAPPRLEFAHLPTRIEELPRLTKLLGGPRLLVKRDDQTGLAFGGNKTRKLEFLVAEALARGDLAVRRQVRTIKKPRQAPGLQSNRQYQTN
jgi:hypothetical protein